MTLRIKSPITSPRILTPGSKRKGNCYVYGKQGHHAAQCRRRARGDNPPKTNVNLVQGDVNNNEEIIAAVISQTLIISDMKKWDGRLWSYQAHLCK